MTDKERLEEIKNKKFFEIKNFFNVGNDDLLDLEDVNWLIEQAERVNELEQQNKRYREALNTIITLWIASTDATDDTRLAHEMSETARKALEGENNE